MSLLWHDSLGSYTSSTSFARSFLSPTGSIDYRQAHQFPGLFSISGHTFSFRTRALQDYQSASQGFDVAIVGFRMKLNEQQAASTPQSFLSIMTGGDGADIRQIQLSVFRNAANPGGTYKIRIELGANQESIYLSKPYSFDLWHYFELKILFAQSTGSVTWRVNSINEVVIDGVRTEADTQLSRKWSHLTVHPNGLLPRIHLADLYACNGNLTQGAGFATFLGDTFGSTLWPDNTRGQYGSVMEWAPTPNPPGGGVLGKWRLVAMAGQSNMNGRGNLPAPGDPNYGKWITPNPYTFIWDRISNFALPRAIQFGVNNHGHLLGPPFNPNKHGPEMYFAQLATNLYYSAGTVPAGYCNTLIVKDAQDGSFVHPVGGTDYTWDFNTPGNLYNDLNGLRPARGNFLTDVASAVAFLGGWASIECFDLFWLQGESDAIWSVSANEYNQRFFALMDRVRSDVGTYVPKTRFHVIQIHKDLTPGTGPDTMDGFWWKETVRNIHRNYPRQHIGDSFLIDIDNIAIGPDRTHFLSPGYDEIGRLMFESWIKQQQFGDYLTDLKSGSNIDELYVAAGLPDYQGELEHKRSSYLLETPKNANNTRILSTRMQIDALSLTNPRTVTATVDGVDGPSQEIAFSASPTAYSRYTFSQTKHPKTNKPFLPEQLADEFGLKT